MNALSPGASPALYLEISPNSLKALHGNEGLELLLERLPNGRLTDACKDKVTTSLQNFLKRKSWQPRARAFCAIGARGVSLRRLALPSAAKDEFHRLLLLQIENEFPLSPDELAWGYRQVGEIRQNGAAKQDLLVMAVKKDAVEDYSEILARCGVTPVFTLAALARSAVCPQPIGTCALLDVGLNHSELISFESGVPVAVRIFPWGDQNPGAADEVSAALTKSLNGTAAIRKLFLSGSIAGVKDRLTGRLGSIECEPLTVPSGEGHSAAVLGLKKSAEENRSLLLFQSQLAEGKAALAQPATVKLAILAAGLAAGLLLLPYLEAFLLKGVLSKKVATLRTEAARLPLIDRELEFLQTLKQSQPPYLDAFYLLAKCGPSGSRIDSINMNRRGEVSLRASMRNSDAVTEFRTKLLSSGFFSSASVDEQSPTPDRQKVNLRMTLVWKPYAERQTLSFGPTAQEIEKARTNKDAQVTGAMPGGMPAGLPPGISLPPGVSLPPGINIQVK